MKLKDLCRRVIAKWPILLLLLMIPALVLAQQDDKDKKKNPPPPPPKKNDSGNPPRQAPPQQHDAPPPHHDPPPNNPPKQTPPNQTPPPERGNPPDRRTPPPNNPPPNNPPKGEDPNRDRGRRPPQGNPPNGNPPPNSGQPPKQLPPNQTPPPPERGNPPDRRTPPPNNPPPNVPPRVDDPNRDRGRRPPEGNPPNGGQPVRGNPPNGGQPPQGNQPPRGNPPNGGQPGQGGQQNGGRPFGGQPNGGQRNREQEHRPVPPPQQVRIHTGNATVIRSANGANAHVTTIRTEHGVTINRTDYGRRVQTVRPGGVVVVSIGSNRGFVQRPAVRVGFVQRTYVVRGRPFVRVYRNYNYRGISYVRYVPAYYYTPRFYIWAYNPWVRPVYFGWGWGRRAPWFYGGYFAPAPYYASASLWLTDYIISENLRAAYEAQLDAEGEQYAPPPPDNSAADPDDYNNAEVSPALRQAIADEVQRQLNAEKNAASNPQQGADNNSGDQAPPALAADQRVFVVSTPLQVYDGDQPCSLTAGDVISRVEDSPGSDGAVGVSVLSSKNADCRPGAQPRIQVEDLQDMSNDLRAQTDEGLRKLSEDQGKNGLPPAPDVTRNPNPNGQGTPDPDAVNQLNQQRQDADQTEKEIGGPGGNVMLMPGAFQLPRAPFAGGIPLVWKPSIRFTLARFF
jgi:hypothetical protein